MIKMFEKTSTKNYQLKCPEEKSKCLKGEKDLRQQIFKIQF